MGKKGGTGLRGSTFKTLVIDYLTGRFHIYNKSKRNHQKGIFRE